MGDSIKGKAKNDKENSMMDVINEPIGASFKFAATLKVNKSELMKAVQNINDIETVELKDKIALVRVESRDIDGLPYLFTIIYLGKNTIEVMYSVTPEISMRKRRLMLLRYVANIITLLKGTYDIDLASFMQVLDVFLAEINEFATSDYEALYTKYDSVLSKLEDARRRIEQLEESNEKISRKLIELKDERDELKLRVSELEKYSDDALMLKIQDWLREHGNEINISDFSKIYKVRESRVEQILNKMVREGYLEVRR